MTSSEEKSRRIDSGGTVGILGGGQLAKMMAGAATRLGYRVRIYTDKADDPALLVTPFATLAGYGDEDALRKFADGVDVVTYEFENVPSKACRLLAERTLVRPGVAALETAQHRVREKDFARCLGVPTAAYRPVSSFAEFSAAYAAFGEEGIVKTASLGYDGKGQARPEKGLGARALEEVWRELRTDDAIYEAFVPFVKEFSILLARAEDGAVAVFPVPENVHGQGILRRSVVPGDVPAAAARQATEHTRAVADALDYVGVMAAEYFLCEGGSVLLNEIAPRPHNSGHWSLDACVTDQFEQHIRAVCGLPLGATDLLCGATMENLIGDDVHRRSVIVQDGYSKLHIYGKDGAKPGRKMGHVTVLHAGKPLSGT
jgi:5-(carboxyamino)imidazole ribonucleotide synthase